MNNHHHLSRLAGIAGLCLLAGLLALLPGAAGHGQGLTPTPTPDTSRWPFPNDLPGNGFTTPPLDVASLPLFFQLATGVEDPGCPQTSPEPGVAVELHPTWLWWDVDQLCLHNLNEALVGTADDLHLQAFTITLVDPQGERYTADFAWQTEDDVHLTLVRADSGAEIDQARVDPYLAVLRIPVAFTADLPAGEWRTIVTTAAGEVVLDAPLPIPAHLTFSVRPADQPANPFSLDGTMRAPLTYRPGDRFTIMGRDYPPDEAVTIALYTFQGPDDDADEFAGGFPELGLPRYATQVTPDEDGRFETEFTVMEDTLFSANYFVLVGDMLLPDKYPGPISPKIFWGNHVRLSNEPVQPVD